MHEGLGTAAVRDCSDDALKAPVPVIVLSRQFDILGSRFLRFPPLFQIIPAVPTKLQQLLLNKENEKKNGNKFGSLPDGLSSDFLGDSPAFSFNPPPKTALSTKPFFQSTRKSTVVPFRCQIGHRVGDDDDDKGSHFQDGRGEQIFLRTALLLSFVFLFSCYGHRRFRVATLPRTTKLD